MRRLWISCRIKHLIVLGLLGLLALPVAADAATLGGVTPASVNTCTTSEPCWVPSTAGAGDTAVRYTWTFSQVTAATINELRFTVPSGTAGGVLTIGDAFGVGGPSSVVLAGDTVSYIVANPAPVAANTQVLVSIDGFTNTGTAGSYSSAVSTYSAGPTLIDGPTPSSAVAIEPSTVDLNVTVEQVVSFSSSTTQLNLNLRPTASPAAVAAPTQLQIATNAGFGYTVTAQATPLATTGGAEILAVTPGLTAAGVPLASFPANGWGHAVSSTTINGTGTFSLAAGLSNGDFSGYATTPQNLASQTSPTNADVINISTRASADLSQLAGVYSSLITYTAIASY